jgi:hypothetical protein
MQNYRVLQHLQPETLMFVPQKELKTMALVFTITIPEREDWQRDMGKSTARYHGLFITQM